MSKVIHKYTLHISNQQLITMPRGAKPLSVQMQDGNCRLWALIDPMNAEGKRIINCCMTGQSIPDFVVVGEHISTVQNNGIVAHFFDGGEYNP